MSDTVGGKVDRAVHGGAPGTGPPGTGAGAHVPGTGAHVPGTGTHVAGTGAHTPGDGGIIDKTKNAIQSGIHKVTGK